MGVLVLITGVVGVLAGSLGLARLSLSRQSASSLIDYNNRAFAELAQKHMPNSQRIGNLADDVISAEDQLPNIDGDDEFDFQNHSSSDELLSLGGGGQHALWGAMLVDSAHAQWQNWGSAWQHWNALDDKVFKAFSHLSGKSVESVSDLFQVVELKEYSLASEGFFNKLMGHIGEWHVEEHFQDAGMDVAMPKTGNEPGLDLYVDDVPLQVKTVKDAASGVYKHFSKYPEIPAIVPSDSANIPESALNFNPAEGLDMSELAGSSQQLLVDSAFSYEDVYNSTEGALDALQSDAFAETVADPSSAIGMSIPWITLAISGYREGKLLLNEQTDLTRAAKNIGIDVTSISVGGFAGAKLGAAFGTVLGPAGTVGGALVGGIAGSISARLAGNHIKMKPLRDAGERYKQSVENYRRVGAEVAVEVSKGWSELSAREGGSLEAELRQQHLHLIQEAETLKVRLQKVSELEKPVVSALFEKLKAGLVAQAKQSEEALNAKVKPFLLPWAGLIAPQEAAEYQRHADDLAFWTYKAEFFLENWDYAENRIDDCMNLVLAVPGGEVIVTNFLKRLNYERKKVYTHLALRKKQFDQQALAQREGAVQRLKEQWEALKRSSEQKMENALSQITQSEKSFRRELERNGIQPE